MIVLFAILLFSILIFVHELGHFVAAKLSGVQVNEFSIFMGPALWKKQIGQTLYSIRLIPIGGYCAMEGEDGDSDNPHAFSRAAWWKKLIILIAGAAMNFAIGVLLMLAFFLPEENMVEPVIVRLEDYCTFSGSQGIQVGDRILEVDGEKIYTYPDFSLLLNLNPSDIHDLVVERDGQEVVLDDLRMEKHPIPGPDGTTQMAYGMSFQVRQMSFGDKLHQAWMQSLDTIRMVRLSLQMLLRGQVGLKDMSGPVGIVQQMAVTAQAAPTWLDAMQNLLYFGGFIAVNLAVMNLLPIPALDGGRVVGVVITTAIEAVTRKKVNPKYEGYIHGAGMLLLLGLMAVVMFKDIFYLFR